ncbi:EAL domain-containing protein [Salinisphaera sp. SPP-AMP-43]|uniref:EAL and HDOD domain-containing protein n=1 Tax=Salinisphaera sp. SPP-AMP-43 TaxID=3121288 RepID=UPI003C6E37AE
MTDPIREQTLYARQLLFDRHQTPVGEELLYREQPVPNRAPPAFDPCRATSQVLVNAFTRNPQAAFSAAHPAFVNFSADMLAQGLPFRPEQLTIEVLESVQASPRVIEQIQRLKADGHRIALDDYCRLDAEHPLLPEADIVKLEYPSIGTAQLAPLVARLKQRRPRLTVLAEKIETQDELEHCLEAGCDVLQGYYLHEPEPVITTVAPIAPSAVAALRSQLRRGPRRHHKLARLLQHSSGLAESVHRLARHWRPDLASQPLGTEQAAQLVSSAQLSELTELLAATQAPLSARRPSRLGRPLLRWAGSSPTEHGGTAGAEPLQANTG